MPRVPSPEPRHAALWLVVTTLVTLSLSLSPRGQVATTYTVFTKEGRKSLPFTVTSGVDMVSLAQVASLFGLTVTEDVAVGGLTVKGRGDTILLIPGQSFARVGASKVVSLSAPVQRERTVWQVPVDFVKQAIGAALNLRVDIRRPTHMILAGDVRVPQISGRFERFGSGGRFLIDVQPTAPRRVTRDGNRLTVRFDAVALDASALTGLVPEFATASRYDGVSLIIDLGPSSATYRVDDRDTRLMIEVQPPVPRLAVTTGARVPVGSATLNAPPPAPPPPAPAPFPTAAAPSRVVTPTAPPAAPPAPIVVATAPPANVPPPVAATPPPTPAVTPNAPPSAPIPPPGRGQAPQEPAVVDVATPGVIRTVVIDPGHGGDDLGARGAGGAIEKDYVLDLARRLKSAIETRIGLRVLLTRDADENVPVDQRTAFANNNKADVFISLHVNASVRPGLAGAQVISLDTTEYQNAVDGGNAVDLPVPVVGGGTRSIELVPWDRAQLPFADRSASVADLLVRHLSERAVPLAPKPTMRMPMRVLVGANMPAILLEVGFFSNSADEPALVGTERAAAIIDALVTMLGDIRRGVPVTGGLAPGGTR